jgi:RHS repeat-associated protein
VGNRSAKTDTASSNVTTYAYDYRQRLTGVTIKTSGGTVNYQATYTYDTLNRRIGTNVDADGAGANAPVQSWTVYDGQDTYADFNGSGTLQARYLNGPAVDELFARTDSAGTTSWYLTDRQNSVRNLVNSSGTITGTISYGSFGKPTTSGTTDRFGYTGREFDTATGLQYNRARYYDAAIGRWTQDDPIGFGGRDANLYRYVGNSPTNGSDPSGLISIYFEGTAQPLQTSGRRTTIQTLFAYSADPNSRLMLNPSLRDSNRSPITEAAVNMIRDTLAQNPHEKIYLYGWSRGGCEAIDVANQLAALNIPVQFLGVIDPVATPLMYSGGQKVNNNVANFFNASRSGLYDTNQKVGWQGYVGDGTIFQPTPSNPDYGSMTPKQSSCMNFSKYNTSHANLGWPDWNPKIYQDVLDRARQAGAPYPAGPLPYRGAPNSTVTDITPTRKGDSPQKMNR